MTLRRRTNSDPWVNVRKATYTYYGSADSHGSLNDLKTAVRFEWSGSAWTELDTSYYRYWKAGDAKGNEHLVKFALNPQAYARLATDVSNPLTASDATVAQYADYYFEYDASQFVTRELVEGGSREYSFTYSINPHYVPNQPEDFNFWMRKTVETLPDGSQNIVFCNDVGLTMLKVFESGSDRWYTFNYYDGVGRVILSASSSAISDYDENLDDLLGLNPITGLFQYLRDDAGLIYKTEYYATTGGGAAAGYLKARYLLKGQLGTPVKLTERQYGSHTAADGVTVHPVTKSIAYRNDDGSGAIETSYAHTWHVSGGLVTNQVLQQTTTLPVVPTTQNGSGTADTADEVFDLLGYRTWSRDPRGFITKFEYDPETGAMTRRIDDVDTAQASGVPTGWSTPAGGGLHLVTDYEHDDQGRITQTLGPVHEVDLNGTATQVRTADWTVYKDAQNRTLSARGYQKVSDGTFTLVNPVSITVTDRNGNVREEIAAVRENTAGKLSPSDTFFQASYVRWTTHQYSDCCKLVSTRVYHTIPVTGEGASGTNYDQTDFGYDVRDRRNRVVSPGGTITFTVFDARSLPVATYVGTNDSGATEDDPTGGGADPNNNMVLVTESEYDNGTAGGDGNLTLVTEYASATDTRVTAFLYDWRNRRTATDGELDFYETLTYDNLDRVIQTERFDTTASGNLIARSETLFDDRGRVYRTIQHEVDPNTGTVGSSLTDDLWYDQNGNVARRQPEGVMTRIEFSYDSLNRLTAQTNPLAVETLFAYDDADNRVSLTDAEDNTTTWGYDPVGRVIKETNELNDTRTFAYDDAGMLSVRTDRNGRVIEFAWDDAGRMTTETWKDGTTTVNTIATAYDADSRITSVLDANATYAYSYDGLGRLTTIDNDGTPGMPRVVLMADHNRLDERTSLATTINNVADFSNAYAHDGLGKVSRIEQTGTGVNAKRVDFNYTALGGFNTISRYADVTGTNLVATTDHEYDGYARLTGTTHAQGATSLSAYNRTFDANRRVDSTATPDGTSDYDYDTAGQLTDADYSFQPDEAYSYDLTGNRTNTGYVTGPNNQLLNDGDHSYSYDPEGNRTKRTTTATNETTEYSWDHRNRLTGITFKDSLGAKTKEIVYTYDPGNRRIAKRLDTDGNGTFDSEERFVFDQRVKGGLDDCILIFDETNTLTHRQLHGPAVDQPLADEQSTTGKTLWYLSDPLGTVHDLIERNINTGTASINNHLTYDSFGNLTGQSNPSVIPLYGFTARDWDADTGLWWYRARWYDAEVGRFVSEDPIGFLAGDVNLQRYVGNNVTLVRDPSGRVNIRCSCYQGTMWTSDTYDVVVNCIGLGDDCCANACAVDGFMVTAYSIGWEIVGQQPDIDPPPLCERSSWSQMSGMDCFACCVEQNSPSAMAQTAIVGAGGLVGAPLGVKPPGGGPLGTPPFHPWRYHPKAAATTSWRNFAKSKGFSPTGKLGTGLRFARIGGYVLIIAEGAYDTGLMSYCACACGIK